MIRDLLGRPLRNLRLSVTDRCNLRCSYCMPEAEYVWLPRHDILQFEEMSRLSTSSRARARAGRWPTARALLRRTARADSHDRAEPAIRDIALRPTASCWRARAPTAPAGCTFDGSLDTLLADDFSAHALRFAQSWLQASTRRQLLRADQARRCDHFGPRRRDRAAARLRETHRGELRFRILAWAALRNVRRARDFASGDACRARQRYDHHADRRGTRAGDRFRLSDGTIFGSSRATNLSQLGDRSRLTADGCGTVSYQRRARISPPLRAGTFRRTSVDVITQEWTRVSIASDERLGSEIERRRISLELENNPHLERHTRGGIAEARRHILDANCNSIHNRHLEYGSAVSLSLSPARSTFRTRREVLRNHVR